MVSLFEDLYGGGSVDPRFGSPLEEKAGELSDLIQSTIRLQSEASHLPAVGRGRLRALIEDFLIRQRRVLDLEEVARERWGPDWWRVPREEGQEQ